MKYLTSKTEVFATSLILSLTVISIAPAQSAVLWWNLEFFDNQGTKIGDGEFSYDPNTSKTIQYDDPVNRESVVDSLTNVIESFTAEINSEIWTLNDANFREILWWETNSNTATNSILITSAGNFAQANFGFTKPPIPGLFPDELVLQGSSNAIFGTGNWTQKDHNGTWEASLRNSETIVSATLINASPSNTVTEPFSLISLVIASFLSILSRKTKSTNSKL